ncbi:MAG: PH domain-containing protein [Erythrobacter sp.]|uniref:PH domain-containing protein n=1 Tax=Erythrobacter sp. TaxID=1042 RepID=UPI002B48A427|nr:PH domain-containing protein [Erythrobacter sp.]WRH69451.1 MAG: PH domain-containing protein [Erythrobacter sp.]
MSDLPEDTVQRTAPLGMAVGALANIRSAIIPAIAIAFSGIGGSGRLLVALGVGLAAVVIGGLFTYLGWRRTTYIIGETDIRLESGLLSRSARSVPYERIQDVSLEAKPLPRLLGLVAVKFETGAGAGEDIALEYLTNAQGEALRQLVRERRDEEAQAGPAASPEDAAAAPSPDPEGEVLFAMSPRRLVTFGLFEFSLAVFAVLGGALQYVDNVTSIDVWDVDIWYGWLKEQGPALASLGPLVQAASAIAGLIALVILGFGTGVVRTALRDWGFTLTRSARGFRRQRGLLTRTDVVMPAHRVQAMVIGTGLLRYRFGWQSLSFVSLAQDDGGESHVVAPFAKRAEIAPIVAAAGFHLPDAATQWHRASTQYRTDTALVPAALIAAAAIPVAIFASPWLAPIPFVVAGAVLAARLYAWQFHRYALDATQIFSSRGFLSPTNTIATRLKLHSIEIAQGPLARLRGYATVHLGLAGGTLAVTGVPLAEARKLRASVIETIAATDYSRLDAPAVQALSGAQSGFSVNLRAT